MAALGATGPRRFIRFGFSTPELLRLVSIVGACWHATVATKVAPTKVSRSGLDQRPELAPVWM